ncbi:hypothetical protein L1987_49290 [Smallanthus sonchifolius]|uniref:Uncharacterized protein n=1 Tax=Smallanthus sonchifolius TaxID=185202 RepID=A0ACB9FTN2_9ASTR|nr:hypothetical protein L1987_49290 [Smallanthus sonchifolius]
MSSSQIIENDIVSPLMLSRIPSSDSLNEDSVFNGGNQSPTHLISDNFIDLDNPSFVCSPLQCVHAEFYPTDLNIPLSGYKGSEPMHVFESPNGTTFWTPNVSDELKPVKGSIFKSCEDVLSMYQKYAEISGFLVRVGQSKKREGVVTKKKYFRCNKYGKPQRKRKFDTLCESSMYVRQSSFSVSDCKAHILLQICKETSCYLLVKFDQNHNHSLIESFNSDLNKISRKLPFLSKQFIHQMSLNIIGPSLCHRLQVSMKGGHHNVHGTATDFKNFSQSIRIFIGDRDSQLVIDRLADRFENLPDFYYDFTVEKGRLRSLFWADEISKLNYQAFGDVLAFDATYLTNKYNMIFVPFTGVDHYKRCVVFGVGLLYSETIDSYKWLLKYFLKDHGKQSTLVLTDQDPSMRQAVLQVFTDSRHRLCMWHIMKKLPAKLSVDTFESRWQELMTEFGLQDHEWLKDMYAIRDHWVPTFFREIPMCCLMKTTSRCESSNSSFKVNSTGANTLVQFMLCYDTLIDKQRYSQRLAEFKTSSASFHDITGLSIEKHAFDLYSHTIFKEVQKGIIKGKFNCYISNTEMVDSICVYSVTHLDKRNDITNIFKVKVFPHEQSLSCSCMSFIRIGYICRHTKDVLPKRIFAIENRYGVDNNLHCVLRNEILQHITECVDFLRGDSEGLTSFAEQIREIKSHVLSNLPTNVVSNETHLSEIKELVGQSIDHDVEINNPQGIQNKGCGKNRRLIAAGEKNVGKGPKAPRLCRTCYQFVTGHDSRNCPENIKDSHIGGNSKSKANPQ